MNNLFDVFTPSRHEDFEPALKKQVKSTQVV